MHSPSCDLENTACRTVAACQRSRVTDEQPEVSDSNLFLTAPRWELPRKVVHVESSFKYIQVLEKKKKKNNSDTPGWLVCFLLIFDKIATLNQFLTPTVAHWQHTFAFRLQ